MALVAALVVPQAGQTLRPCQADMLGVAVVVAATAAALTLVL